MVCFEPPWMNLSLAERGSPIYLDRASCSFFFRKSSPEYFSHSTMFLRLTTRTPPSPISAKLLRLDLSCGVFIPMARARWLSCCCFTCPKHISTAHTKAGANCFGFPGVPFLDLLWQWHSPATCYRGTREHTLRPQWEPTRSAKSPSLVECLHVSCEAAPKWEHSPSRVSSWPMFS